MPLDLTIAIPVKNEEKNLPLCLAKIGKDFASEIIIIDSGSTDKTIDIALENGASVIDFKWDGKFPKKRNWFLRNHTPRTKWILFLDADEYLTEEFKIELASKITDTDVVGYWLKYSIYFMGKELRGGYPLKKLALFQTGSGEYERIDENQWSSLDMEVHEHPVLKGKTGQIKAKIDHRDFRDLSYYIRKHNEYANWEAHRLTGILSDKNKKRNFTLPQKLKYMLMQSPLIGPVFFVGSYIVLGGFLDGIRGLSFSLLKMSYFNQIYCLLQESKRHPNQ